MDILPPTRHSEQVGTRFREDLRASEIAIGRLPLEAILESFFPGIRSLTKTSSRTDKKGADYEARLANGDSAGIDAKLRRSDPRQWGKDDLAIEIWSSMEHRVTGYKGAAADFILWLFPSSGRAALAPFRPFQRRVAEKRNLLTRSLPLHTQVTIGKAGNMYHSAHVFAPYWLFYDIIRETTFPTIHSFTKTSLCDSRN